MHTTHRTTNRTQRAALLAALVTFAGCEPTAPRGRPIEHNGVTFYLSGTDLRDARGRVVATNAPEVVAQMNAALDGAVRVQQLERTVLRTPRALAALAAPVAPNASADMQSDICTDAFRSLYAQTQQYKILLAVYWSAYFASLSLNAEVGPDGQTHWSPGVPNPKVAVNLVSLGIEVITARTGLDFLATEIRVWGCL